MIEVKAIAKAKTTGGVASGGTVSSAAVGGVAEEAKHAVKADMAEQAKYAEKAGYATKAAYSEAAGAAERAVEAEHATKADTADEAVHAGEADHAVRADEATHAGEADHAIKADAAEMAEVAKDLTEDSPVNDRFLSAVADDIAHGAITFNEGLTAVKKALLKGGAEFGEYDAGGSWTGGKGAVVDKDGNMAVESLRVRSYLECVELIVNRLTALEGDQLLTESDTIEKAEDLGGGAWGLTLREKWEGYFTGQAVGNVVKGIMNTMAEAAVESGVETPPHEDETLAGEKDTAAYSTSWMRVNAVDAARNYVEVSLYADDEVPGGRNYPPCAMMRIARWGNQTDEKRQECLYLSSTEGRIVKLTGVTKPILEAGNYGVTLGSLPDFVKTLTDDSGNALPLREGLDYLYAPGVVTMDVIRLNRWTRKPVAEYVDRGVWQEGGRYYCEAVNEETGVLETSDVWHKGCKYRCMKTGTTAEPTRTGTDWAVVGGYPDLGSTYEMEFDTGGDTLIGRGEEKQIRCLVVNGLREDVTEAVTAWKVERDSGDEAADAVWYNAHRRDFAGTLTITLDDLNGAGKVTFTVTAEMDGTKVTGEINV